MDAAQFACTSPAQFAGVNLEAFLHHEAAILDSSRLDLWLGMFAQTCRYVVPYEPLSDVRRLTILNDDRQRLEERVFRITSGLSFTQSPASRTIHFISNVVAMPKSASTVTVNSNQLVAVYRKGKQQIFATTCTHELVVDQREVMIAQKVVLLLNRDQPLPELTFLF